MIDYYLRAKNAADLIQLHHDFPEFAEKTWEQFYVTAFLSMGEQARPLADAQKAQLNSYIAHCGELVMSSENGLVINNKCPVIAEKRAISHGLRDEFLDEEEALVISKDEARVLHSIRGPFTLVADNILIVERPGQEDAIALIVRDADAPSPFSECCPGGWVGPGDYTETAKKKLDNEIAFIMPDGKRRSFTQLQKRGLGKEVKIEGVTRDFNIEVKGLNKFGKERTSTHTLHCAPFFHLSANPDAQYDANMLNLLRIVRVRLPEGAQVIDNTKFGRKIDLVPISDMDKPRYGDNGQVRPQLPTVAYATRLAPALIAA